MKNTTLNLIREMTKRIKEATDSEPITEKRYQYSKDECQTIFDNVFKAVEEYTTKSSDESAYESLLNSLADRFKTGSTGGNISKQVDSLSSADFLFEHQTQFQELLDSAKDVIEFINNKTDKLEGTSIKAASSEKIETPKTEENKETDEIK